jgi:hypothetical protein
MSDEGRHQEKERLIAAVEVEMADILVREHGMESVRVSLDRETGDIVSSQPIPDELKAAVFAAAIKRAIVKRVHEMERGE